MPWSAIGSALSSAAGSLLDTGISAYANHREAAINRDWQERMIKNQYSYAVEDLKRAGLNPALAYGGLKASVSSGAQAAPTQSNLSKAFDIAQLKLLKAQEKLAEQQTKSNAQQTDAKSALDLASAREVNARAKTEEMKSAWYSSLSPSERYQLFNTRETGGSTIQQMRSFANQIIRTVENSTASRVGKPEPKPNKSASEMSPKEKDKFQREQASWIREALRSWGFRQFSP